MLKLAHSLNYNFWKNFPRPPFKIRPPPIPSLIGLQSIDLTNWLRLWHQVSAIRWQNNTKGDDLHVWMFVTIYLQGITPTYFRLKKRGGGGRRKKKRKIKKINNWTHDATGSDLIGYMLRWFVKWSYKQLRGGGIGTTYQLMTDWDFDIKCQL